MMDGTTKPFRWWPSEQPVGFPRPHLVTWLSRVALSGFVVSYLISSHMPSLSTESLGFPNHSDKLIHTGIFFVITVLMLASLRTALPESRKSFRVWLTWAGVFLAVVGIEAQDGNTGCLEFPFNARALYLIRLAELQSVVDNAMSVVLLDHVFHVLQT